MVDMFNQEEMCNKYFKEGNYAPTVTQVTKKEIIEDPEEVIHVDDELPPEGEKEGINENMED